MALHSFWEWIVVVYDTQYVFAISLGIIAGSIEQARLDQLAQARLWNQKARTPPNK